MWSIISWRDDQMRFIVWAHSSDRIRIWKCWFLRNGENRSTRRKTSPNKDENQQQTQPTYDAESGNRTRTTLVGDEFCTIPAPLRYECFCIKLRVRWNHWLFKAFSCRGTIYDADNWPFHFSWIFENGSVQVQLLLIKNAIRIAFCRWKLQSHEFKNLTPCSLFFSLLSFFLPSSSSVSLSHLS